MNTVDRPTATVHGEYWWYRSSAAGQPEILLVVLIRGRVKVTYHGALIDQDDIHGEWCGPVDMPEHWLPKR